MPSTAPATHMGPATVEFFDKALIDVDGNLVGTDEESKESVDIAYDGTWSYLI